MLYTNLEIKIYDDQRKTSDIRAKQKIVAKQKSKKCRK